MTKPKKRILKVIRKSLLTGKAIWVGVERTYNAEWKAYKRACQKESLRMNLWSRTMARRKKNILFLLNELTARLPILGDITKEQREAVKFLTQMAEKEPPKQSDFFDHIQEERRQRYNAFRRERRWKEKHSQDS
jgi:hypothetical protein